MTHSLKGGEHIRLTLGEVMFAVDMSSGNPVICFALAMLSYSLEVHLFSLQNIHSSVSTMLSMEMEKEMAQKNKEESYLFFYC